MPEYDLLVIGGGPAGYVAAIRAAQCGAKVALAEKDKLGGTCLNQGCIPTKALAASASLMAQFERAGKFGVLVSQPKLDYARVLKRKDNVVQRLGQGVNYLMEKNKITVLQGSAQLKSRDTVEINSQIVRAGNIIIATGSTPAMPKDFCYDGVRVINSTDLLVSPNLPSSIIIVGGGVVGCEFSSIFRALGVQVTLVEMADRLLPFADKEVSKHLAMAFKRRNIDVRTGARVENVKIEGGVQVTLAGGEMLAGDKLLVAIGRTPYTHSLGLEEVGVDIGSRGEILVDANLETNIPGIFAIGDVNNLSNLAHAASAQGVIVAERLFAAGQRQFDPIQVPAAVFTVPELAMSGETEEQLQARGVSYTVGKSSCLANGKSICDGEDEGFVKVLAAGDGRLLGIHIVAAHASELIHEAVAIYTAGLSVNSIADSIHVHPSVGEMLMEAAEAACALQAGDL